MVSWALGLVVPDDQLISEALGCASCVYEAKDCWNRPTVGSCRPVNTCDLSILVDPDAQPSSQAMLGGKILMNEGCNQRYSLSAALPYS